MERHRISLVFGGSVDRESGLSVVPPGAMEEVKNLWLRDGRATVRRGYEETVRIEDHLGRPLEAICLVAPLRSEGSSIVVGLDVDRRVDLYRASGSGEHAAHLGVLDTLDELADTPPRFSAAEIYGGAFLAHDEASIARRLPTYVYSQATGRAEPLVVQFGPAPRGEEEDTRPEHTAHFLGVARHLAYLIGWGWGIDATPRPELLRISRPGEPSNFSDDVSFTIGYRGDPVVACYSVGQSLVIFKESEFWRLDGYDYATFGVRPADPLFGLAASRLAVVVGDSCFFWSLEGPRVTTGGESVDLALPLGLGGPQPVDLEAEGVLSGGFAVYHPVRQAVLFLFGRHAYVLNLRGNSGPRWSYHLLAHAMTAGGVVYSARATPGYVMNIQVVETTPSTVTLSWDRVEADGSEQVELWLRRKGEGWPGGSVKTLPSFEAGTMLEELESGAAYEVAIRARLSGQTRPGFAGKPDEWTAPEAVYAFKEFTTDIAEGSLTAAWRRVSAAEERIKLTLTDADPSKKARFYRGAASAGPWTEVGDVAEGVGEFDYIVQAGEGETLLWFYAEQYSGDTSQDTEAVRRWVGPDAPVDLVQTDPPGSGGVAAYWYAVSWEMGWAGAATRIEDSYDCLPAYTYRHTSPAGGITHSQRVGTTHFDLPYGTPITLGFSVRARHEVTTAGITDFSEWESVSVEVEAQDPDEWPEEQGPWPGDGFDVCGS